MVVASFIFSAGLYSASRELKIDSLACPGGGWSFSLESQTKRQEFNSVQAMTFILMCLLNPGHKFLDNIHVPAVSHTRQSGKISEKLDLSMVTSFSSSSIAFTSGRAQKLTGSGMTSVKGRCEILYAQRTLIAVGL
jgi:hypothetical protein